MKTIRYVSMIPGAVLLCAVHAQAPEFQGNTIETARHQITLDDSGLPAQILIKADQTEVPLALRAGGELNAARLIAIDRGPQLAAPIRIEAQIDGKWTPLTVKQSARPKTEGDAVTASTRLEAEGVTVTLDSSYSRGGVLTAQVDYTLEVAAGLRLAVDLEGPVDTVIPGPAVEDTLRVYSAADYAVPAEEGLVWSDTRASGTPGPFREYFVGNGGRGFTWKINESKGFGLTGESDRIQISRDDTGKVSWHIYFVNQADKSGSGSVNFDLATHPQSTRDADARRSAWLQLESRDGLRIVSGPKGGDALSREHDHIDTYPLSLFRHLAGSHTGQISRVETNSGELITAGMNRSHDRAVLGRALLLDMGLDVRGLAHLNNAGRLVSALHAFGYFENDGKTEYIPYWRQQGILRYGEVFSGDSAFELTETDPAAHVRVSTFIRPRADGEKGFQTLFVVLNEGDTEIRERLYLLDTERIFGGRNAQHYKEVIGNYDYSFVPASDWAASQIVPEATRAHETGEGYVLKDLEDSTTVTQADSNNPSVDIYGPIHLRPRDFRIFYAYGDPDRAASK